MARLNSNQDRLAANHHRDREPASPIVTRRRGHRPVSHAVQQDTFRPVPTAEQRQARVAYMGARIGTVSLGVSGHPAGFTAARPLRGQPQARIASERDRSRIEGAKTPGAHPAIGRSVISPILLSGGSEL